jgi:hypothetical protein
MRRKAALAAMKSVIRIVVAVLAVSFCLLVGAMYWPNLVACQRDIAIDRELAGLPEHDWAGHYSGQCWDLRLAPKSGFSVHFLPPFYHFGEPRRGSVEEHDGQIQLNWSSSGESSSFHLIRWGKRRYLVNDTKLFDFYLAARMGYEPRHHSGSWFLGRIGNEQDPVIGLPDVPDAYLHFMRRDVVRAKVKSIDQRWDNEEPWKAYVTLEGGTAEGVVPGLAFALGDPQMPSGQIEVLNATEHTALGLAIISSGQPQVGQLLEWRWPPRDAK